VNAISISEEVDAFFARPDAELGGLQACAEWIARRFGMSACFCEIVGARWSHVAGSGSLLFAERRAELNGRLGILAEGGAITAAEWDELVAALRSQPVIEGGRS